jgi:hypothetical protein
MPRSNGCHVSVRATRLLRKDLSDASLCAFFRSGSIGMKRKHIGPVIVARHIQVELAPLNFI